MPVWPGEKTSDIALRNMGLRPLGYIWGGCWPQDISCAPACDSFHRQPAPTPDTGRRCHSQPAPPSGVSRSITRLARAFLRRRASSTQLCQAK